jgi:serine/threonine protein phosphatase PrpC
VLNENLDGLAGTTVCLAIVYKNILYVANVGDSAAILYRNRKVVAMTELHTPKNPDERKRIEEFGGVITKKDRLGHPSWNPSLIHIALSRSLGNVYFKHSKYTDGKESGLSVDPYVAKVQLTSEDRFLLMASDGRTFEFALLTLSQGFGMSSHQMKQSIL